MGNKTFGFVLSFIGYITLVSLIYLYDTYAGFLMNLIFGAMIASVLIISLITEFIQKSKVPKIYFWSLAGAILACFLCILLFEYDLTQ